ncbi:MAG: 2-oxoacid:acceptor oxidoreductase family protein [Chloroflexi bacterium]|nr:2-oxoacid:acceptor oxidoreductase family protein [Chloroflexota bacterium]
MAGDLYEVRWHARGGQGAVTASRFLSASASRENKHFQGFPEFGTERMGAPIQAFTRLSSQRIYTHEQVTTPDAVVVLDPTLLEVVDVTAGLKPGCPLIINSDLAAAELRKQLPKGSYKLYTVNATKIATESVGRPITNTAMVGALVKITELIAFKAVEDELRSMFGSRFKQSVVDGNVKALQRAYEEVKGE